MSSAVEQLLGTLDARVQRAEALEDFARVVAPPVLSLRCEALQSVLPDGGLPRGVTELAAPKALGGTTRIGVDAVCAAQQKDAQTWCAWVDPEASLYAPALAQAGVDLTRLLVVWPPRVNLGRIALKVVRSGAFDVVLVDMDAVGVPQPQCRSDRPPELLVRQLALAAQEAGTCVLLLTDSSAPRAVPWPVALRLEIARPSPHQWSIRVAKDRRGRVSPSRLLPFPSASP